MADEQRQGKIAEEIRNQAGKFFSTESLVGTLATVTDVSMSPDLNYADIFISVLPVEKKEEALEKAKKALPGLRRQIGNNLKLRQVPELRLYYDNRSDAKERVEEILSDL
jgi:ribosome-binding factor A